MELTGLLQIAPFQGMKEEELVALLFGLPNSLKHFEPGDIIARQGGLYAKDSSRKQSPTCGKRFPD